MLPGELIGGVSAHGRRPADRQFTTLYGHPCLGGECRLGNRNPRKQPFRLNDQVLLRTNRVAGWPSAAAFC